MADILKDPPYSFLQVNQCYANNDLLNTEEVNMCKYNLSNDLLMTDLLPQQ